MTRHCMSCDAEVEDTGGYCLLGHPLRQSFETASLEDLKNEVEEAFQSAQDEVRDSLEPLIEQIDAAAPVREPAMAAAGPQGYAAPEASTRAVPPPPPPRQPESKFKKLWEGMDEVERPLDRHDPINAFAPPPRMDWGPERSSRKSRALRKLRPSNA